MKLCLKCHLPIDEFNPQQKWFMAITKLGQKITAFECFHYECWVKFWNESVGLETMSKMEKKKIKIAC